MGAGLPQSEAFSSQVEVGGGPANALQAAVKCSLSSGAA